MVPSVRVWLAAFFSTQVSPTSNPFHLFFNVLQAVHHLFVVRRLHPFYCFVNGFLHGLQRLYQPCRAPSKWGPFFVV